MPTFQVPGRVFSQHRAQVPLLPLSAVHTPTLASSFLLPPPFLLKRSAVEDADILGLATALPAAAVLGVLVAP